MPLGMQRSHEHLLERVKSHSLTLADEPGYGLAARASRPLEVGDLVLQEEAFVKFQPLGPLHEDMLKQITQRCRAYGSSQGGPRGPQFWKPALEVGFGSLPRETAERMDRDFYARAVEWDAASLELAGLLGRDLGWPFTPAQTLRLLKVIDINIHRDDEFAKEPGLYLAGSKFSHSCAPNCLWEMSRGVLSYYAIRPVAAGELLTFSYTSDSMNLLDSAPGRQEKLKALDFDCLCARCAAPDLGSRLICPSCRAPELTPSPHSAGVTWRCRACREEPAVPLRPQIELATHLFRRVFEFWQRPDSESNLSTEQRDKEALWLESKQKLGPSHYVTVLAAWLVLSQYLCCLETRGYCDFSEDDALETSDQVCRWITEVMPSSLQALRFHAQACALRYQLNRPDAGACIAPYLPQLRLLVRRDQGKVRPGTARDTPFPPLSLAEELARKAWSS